MPPAAIGTQWARCPLPFEWREHYHGVFRRRSSCESPGTLAIFGNYCDHPRKSTYVSIASIHSCAGCLCAYDARHSSLLRIRPSSGHVDAFHLPLEADGYARLVAWHENLVIFAEGGQEREVLGELGHVQKATNRRSAWWFNFLWETLRWVLSGSLTTHAIGLCRGHVTETPSWAVIGACRGRFG